MAQILEHSPLHSDTGHVLLQQGVHYLQLVLLLNLHILGLLLTAPFHSRRHHRRYTTSFGTVCSASFIRVKERAACCAAIWSRRNCNCACHFFSSADDPSLLCVLLFHFPDRKAIFVVRSFGIYTSLLFCKVDLILSVKGLLFLLEFL